MRFLDTARAELYTFPDSAAVPGGYAILSRAWTQGSEKTPQEARKINDECKITGEDSWIGSVRRHTGAAGSRSAMATMDLYRFGLHQRRK